MSQWTDPGTWAKLRSGEACVICRQGAPGDILVELEISWVTVNEDAPMRGYACPANITHERRAINPKAVRKPYAPGEITDIRRRLLEALVR